MHDRGNNIRSAFIMFETVQHDRVIIITGDLTYTKSLIYNIAWW